MPQLNLSTAIGNYGHTKSLKDGTLQSELFAMKHVEVSPVPMIFRRMVRGLEFDVAEMALSTYICAKHYGKPFTALPVFLTRAFYHGGIICNSRSGIKSASDLAGRRVGVRSYTLTPGVWTRSILQTEYGLDLDSVTWVLSGDEHVEEYIAPPNVVSSPNNDLREMLLSGEIDAVIGTGAIDSPNAVPLFQDPEQADAAWFSKTHIYPISHLLVVRDEALEQNPWLAKEMFSLFKTAKDSYVNGLRSQEKLHSEDAAMLQMAKLVDGDPLPYEFEGARIGLETFIRFMVEQHIIPQHIDPNELFPPETLSLC